MRAPLSQMCRPTQLGDVKNEKPVDKQAANAGHKQRACRSLHGGLAFIPDSLVNDEGALGEACCAACSCSLVWVPAVSDRAGQHEELPHRE
jgi:hypothetical protein